MLRSGFILLAQRLQEAADISHKTVRDLLSSAVQDAHKGTGSWANYVDHTGDGESGDCIYSCDSSMCRAPYEIRTAGDKTAANVDTAKAEKVIPVMAYQKAADDDDNYTTMEEAFKTSRIYTELPIYERFISKAERASADEGSFAGKNKSFPILKAADVSAAVHAMGRAGSDNYPPVKLKANIIRIAKEKGWAGELPSSWTDATKTSEAQNVARETSGLKLVESAGVELLGAISVTEAARTTYPIKVISPGTGSSAHYPAHVVEKMAPLVKPGTLMFWNHQTSAQEAERPEGDLDHLAAIITKQGEWKAEGPKGPGVYAEAKVMADYAQKVEERAPHIGLSIRAGGTTTGKTVNGKPELKSIDHIESIDYVTKAGRGGMALVEAAKSAGLLPEAARHAVDHNKTGDEMTVEQQNMLREAGRLVLHGEARRVALDALSDVSLNESAKEEVIRRVTKAIPTKEGLLDEATFRESVKDEAKAIGAFVASVVGSGRVYGMGAGAPAVQLTEAQREAAEKAEARALKEAENVFADLMGNPVAAAIAAKGRAA